MALTFQCADRSGSAWVDGRKVADMFGCEDLAAALAFAEQIRHRTLFIRVYDPDLCDVNCSGERDWDHLTDDEFDRAGRLNSIDWYRWDDGSAALLDDGTALMVDQYRGEWRGQVNNRPRVICKTREEAEIRVAAIAIPMGVAA